MEFEEHPLTKRLAGLIVAGGEGKRLGGQKPLQAFGGGVLLDAVIARLCPQVDVLALNVPMVHAAIYRARYGTALPLLLDPFEQSCGPLGGVLAGLEWLEEIPGYDWLVTFPCDTPFLPEDLVAQLVAQARVGVPAMARAGEQTHGLCALWPPGISAILRNGIADGTLRSMTSALDALGGRFCDIVCHEHAFFNVNTPEDLARASEIAQALDL